MTFNLFGVLAHLILPRSDWNVKIIGQRSRSRENNVAKEVDATSREGFLVPDTCVINVIYYLLLLFYLLYA